MSIYEPAPQPWPDRMLAVFRVVAGLMFFWAGTMKIFNFPPMPPGQPPIELMSQVGIGGMMEVVGGILIMLGLLTRPVAFVLAGEMAVAYFQFHQPMGLLPNENGGIPAVLYCFFFLYLVAAGPGAWSVDRMIARSRNPGRMVDDRVTVPRGERIAT